MRPARSRAARLRAPALLPTGGASQEASTSKTCCTSRRAQNTPTRFYHEVHKPSARRTRTRGFPRRSRGIRASGDAWRSDARGLEHAWARQTHRHGFHLCPQGHRSSNSDAIPGADPSGGVVQLVADLGCERQRKYFPCACLPHTNPCSRRRLDLGRQFRSSIIL